MPHATGSIECILSNRVGDTVSQLLRVLLVIFRNTAGTRVSTVVAYPDFTSRSPDYVLTKLSQTITA